MDVSSREALSSSLDELVHKIIVFLAPFTMLSQAQVKIITEKFFVLVSQLANVGYTDIDPAYICSAIQHHW